MGDIATTEAKLSKWELIKKAEGTFWFLRGIFAAGLIVAAVPNFTGLSRWQSLEIFELFALKWKDWFGWLAEWVKVTLHVPHVSASVLHGLLFILAFGIPGIIASLPVFWRSLIRSMSVRGKSILSYGKIAILIIWIIVIITIVTMITYLTGTFAYTGIPPGGYSQKILPGTLLIVFDAVLFVSFACYMLKGYFKGLVIICLFLLSLQCLYWMNAPTLPGLVDKWVADARIH